ncbi:MAG: hypothetical protein ACRDQ5_02770 [Sciscionella sp.]
MSLGDRLSAEGRRTIRERLIAEVGGYLSNVVRERQGTCDVCSTPVEPSYALCWRCQRDREEFGDELADLVLFLCYGVKGSQSGYLMHSYKDLEAPARHNQTLLSLLLLAALDRHGNCIERCLGSDIDTWAIVPSARIDRTGEYPLHVVSKRAGISLPEVELIPRQPPTPEDRTTSRDRFVLRDGEDARERHILLIEDTWTSGGNAQSAALTLRRAGAVTVTIVALARWLTPQESSTADFATYRLTRDYDPLVCPLGEPACARQR